MFAELMCCFAKESNVIDADAPFIRLNCADYADNPQLVMAQIFGVKKGAYSGADADREGLLKKADKGIFFLDEVHRLSPQGQEMLFTYMDKGCFRPLGETEKLVYAEVQIITATTEDPQSMLLKTFTRRIPMTITLPSLKERSLKERYGLLGEFILTEAKRLGKSIYIEKNALLSLLLYDCPNNIGQLKSDLQLSCAKAFLRFTAQNSDYILIDQTDLHQRVKSGLMKIQEYRDEIEQLLRNKGDLLVFSDKAGPRSYRILEELNDCQEQQYFYDIIEKKVEQLKRQGLSEKEINDLLNIDLEKYFKKYLSDLPGTFCKDEITKIVDVQVVDTVEKILAMAQRQLHRSYNKKVYYGLALHLHKSIDRIRYGSRIYHPKLNLVRTQYADEFLVAMEIAKTIDRVFNIETPLDEIGYLAMFLASDAYEEETKRMEKVAVLVIMHGHATASSMCQVVNSLIGEEHACAMDMPLSMKAAAMYEAAKQEIRALNTQRGVLLLVDMGSLDSFGHMISEETGIKIRTISRVSTPMVLDACRNAIAGHSLDAIYRSCHEVNRYSIQQAEVCKKTVKKQLIVTACFTGEGAAEQLKAIIQKQLQDPSIHITPLNILDHNDFLDNIQKLNCTYEILAVVGTVNVYIENVPFIPAPDILDGPGIERLQKLIDAERQYTSIRNFLKDDISLRGVEVFEDTREILENIERTLGIIITEDVKVGLLLHIVFMVDKLIHGGESRAFYDLQAYQKTYSKEFAMMGAKLRFLEHKYHIVISEK
ncbi:sigma 54-interacting transcriptional regulator [Acetonema longum]|uniref:sigma 54-interacting transcriptional regulator n=1 Tax=Acetonema longum TaxID=2374 RepID=UPI001930922D|nr:sigma 54-interacting transcriptional regulator [Acetonema longum]